MLSSVGTMPCSSLCAGINTTNRVCGLTKGRFAGFFASEPTNASSVTYTTDASASTAVAAVNVNRQACQITWYLLLRTGRPRTTPGNPLLSSESPCAPAENNGLDRLK